MPQQLLLKVSILHFWKTHQLWICPLEFYVPYTFSQIGLLFLPNFKYEVTVGVCYLSLIGSIGFQYQAADGGSYIGILANLWILIWRRLNSKEKATFIMNLDKKNILTTSALRHVSAAPLGSRPAATLDLCSLSQGTILLLTSRKIIRNEFSKCPHLAPMHHCN